MSDETRTVYGVLYRDGEITEFDNLADARLWADAGEEVLTREVTEWVHIDV